MRRKRAFFSALFLRAPKSSGFHAVLVGARISSSLGRPGSLGEPSSFILHFTPRVPVCGRHFFQISIFCATRARKIEMQQRNETPCRPESPRSTQITWGLTGGPAFFSCFPVALPSVGPATPTTGWACQQDGAWARYLLAPRNRNKTERITVAIQKVESIMFGSVQGNS